MKIEFMRSHSKSSLRYFSQLKFHVFGEKSFIYRLSRQTCNFSILNFRYSYLLVLSKQYCFIIDFQNNIL